MVKPRLGGLTYRGPHPSKIATGGAGENPAGQRLAPDIGHRVDTDQEGRAVAEQGIILCVLGGTEAGGRICNIQIGQY